MKKISFDVEDHPPPSYYKEPPEVVQTERLNTVVTHQPSSTVDKSEWWKAPEFVPKSFKKTDQPGVHHISENSVNRLQPVPEVIEKQQNVKIQQPLNFPQPGFPLPMPTPIPAPGQIRPYPPPPVFPLPGMPRPFFPQLPLLPPVQQFNPFYRQQIFRQPRPYPRNVTLNNTGIPSGYTANMTTINGLGAQIPAIVIKKKRKKKTKKGKDLFSTSMYENDKVEAIMAEQKSKESSPDDKSSTVSQPEVGRSEPDLMSLHKSSPSTNFPADLDLIQSTTNCTMLTGSWPDLSEPQRQMLHNSGVYKMYYDEQFNDVVESNNFCNRPDNVEFEEQIVFDSRLKQSALTHSSKDWEEHENEESALLNDSHGNGVNHKGQKKLPEDGRSVIVHSTGDGTTSQLLPNDSSDGSKNFKSNRRRTFSLPDVPLVPPSASKVCCSIM